MLNLTKKAFGIDMRLQIMLSNQWFFRTKQIILPLTRSRHRHPEYLRGVKYLLVIYSHTTTTKSDNTFFTSTSSRCRAALFASPGMSWFLNLIQQPHQAHLVYAVFAVVIFCSLLSKTSGDFAFALFLTQYTTTDSEWTLSALSSFTRKK